MSTVIDALARALAYGQGRAYPVRTTSALSRDPTRCFGIAPLKVVSEEHVQAVAFGDMGGQPRVIVRWTPLGRDPGDLEPFADALDTYLGWSRQAGEPPRVWVPYPAALALLELLGHRYRTNSRASVTLRRMGWQCRVLTDEARYAGQQVVVVATD